jgi:GTPase SAR1 family protein
VAMRDLYINNGQGFVIVYSITTEGTFDELRQIYSQIMNIKVNINYL